MSLERERTVRYLLEEAPLPAETVRHKLAASHALLEAEVVGLGEEESRRHAGQWPIQDIIDHLAKTNIRAPQQ